MSNWVPTKGYWEEHGTWHALVIDDWVIMWNQSMGESRIYLGLKERRWKVTLKDGAVKAQEFKDVPKDIEVIARMLSRKGRSINEAS